MLMFHMLGEASKTAFAPLTVGSGMQSYFCAGADKVSRNSDAID